MRSSLRIAKLFGIPVEIHWTFLLLLVWVFFAGGGTISQWKEILIWLLTIVALFTCVVLHEFGHALTAKRFGIRTRDIILSPIGGVARLEGLPEKPIQEFWVAIAGPLVNVGIIALLLPVQFLFPSTFTHFLGLFSEESNTFLWEMFRLEYMIPFLISINIMLVLFNLLPAFPMDGGRVLRALLAMRMDRVSATRWAARIGQALAILLCAWGLYQMNLVLSFIGLFVFMAAGAEYRYVRTEGILIATRIGDILPADLPAGLRLDDSLHDANEALKNGKGPHFPVFNAEGKLEGLLYEDEINAFIKSPPMYPVQVRERMHTPSTALFTNMTLKEAYAMLSKLDPVLPVYAGTHLAGLVSISQLNQYIQNTEKSGSLFRFKKPT